MKTKAAQTAAYYEANKEELTARAVVYRESHKEEIAVYRNREAYKEKDKTRRIVKKYDISRRDAEMLVALRDGPGAWCDICRTPEGSFQIDHDHTTGKIRGILCGPCNKALGHIEAGPGVGVLSRMVAYVKEAPI